jgi:hypothetical protein
VNVKEYIVYIVYILLYCICRIYYYTVYAEYTTILYMQNILYIYYPYIVKRVYGDIVISVQYIRIYTMYIYYQYFKNSLIIHEENTKKNHKRVVSLYVDKDFPSFT